MDLGTFLNAWHLMRIRILASSFLSEEIPQISFPFDLTMKTCYRFIQSNYNAPFTWFITNNQKEIYNIISNISEKFSFKISGDIFIEDVLRPLDNGTGTHKGVFVTAHWLTYIFDMQERADFVWSQFPLFYSLALSLHEERKLEFLEKNYLSEKGKIVDPWSGISFSHRYHDKHLLPALKRTLKILSEYGGLPTYLDEIFRKSSLIGEDNWVRFMATALYMLTYDADAAFPPDENQLFDYAWKEKFVIKLTPFTRNKIRKIRVPGTKRLWAALRDYLVDPYFRRLFIEGLSDKNPIIGYFRKFDSDPLAYEEYLSQLELPGDVWNEEFQKNYICKLNLKENIIIKDSRTSARRLYLYLLESSDKFFEKLYPVYLDVAWELRGKNLESFFERAEKAMQTIQKELGKMPETKKDILESFNIMRYNINMG